jgi:DNA-binding response OmpR family regulator
MKILVIEDDLATLKLMKIALEKHGYSVIGAENGLNGFSAATDQSFDSIVLDIGLPDISGLEVLKRLRANQNQTPVLLLSAYDDTDTKVSGLENGADDYMTKPFDLRELLARLYVITRRRIQARSESNEILTCGELHINLLTREFMVRGKKIPLTNNEFSLLVYFLKNQGRIIDRMELSEKVWGISFDTQTNFVNVYLSYLRRKIREATDKEYIETIRGEGFRMIKEPSTSHQEALLRPSLGVSSTQAHLL